MKFLLALAGVCAVSILSAYAEKIALVGGTVINPRDGKIIPHAVVVIEGDKIASVGSRQEKEPPADARVIDCTDKFIVPGYIDTHVHFFQSGGLFTRPDVVDLTTIRSYKDEIAWVKSHLDETFARYLRVGITSVVDIGGPMWNFEVRKRAAVSANAPRVAVAGPLISSVARPQLELEGDPPIVKIDTPEQGVAVRAEAGEEKTGLRKNLVRRRTRQSGGKIPPHRASRDRGEPSSQAARRRSRD